jgi:hypothetical protein
MQGGTHQSGMISGFLGSIGASTFGMVASEFSKTAEGIVLSGAVLGGVGAELVGGNFWQGALVGGMVAGLNHYLHSTSQKQEYRGNLKKELIDAGWKTPDKTPAKFEDGDAILEKTKPFKDLTSQLKAPTKIINDPSIDTPGETIGGNVHVNMNIDNKTILDFAFTIGHELIHVWDNQFNYYNYREILGRTKAGSDGAVSYMEHRAYNWMNRWGDTTNYSNVLKVLYSPKKVMDNYSKLKAASINPW